MAAPRLVTFDVTNTILKFRNSPGYEYCKAAKKFGVDDIDENQLTACFKKYLKLQSECHPNFGANSNMTYQKWWQQVVEQSFQCAGYSRSSELLRKISDQLMKDYQTKECWKINKNVIPLFNALKEQGHTIGVISNFDDRLRGILRHFEILKRVDFVIASYEAKCMKPDKKIFDLALLACPHVNEPMEALHVGDDVDKDYEGARAAGWNALILTDEPESEKFRSVNKEHIITDIIQLDEFCKKIFKQT